MNLMNWSKCEKEFIRKVEPDLEKVNSIIEKAEERLDLVRKIETSEKKISFIVEGYYEIIKELLVAYMLKQGLRSKNHRCLITFFYKQNSDFESEANLISQMSYFRNRLSYYGETIPKEFYEKNKSEFEKIIGLIKEKLTIKYK